MFNLLCNCTHFTCQQDYAQNSSSQASTVCEPRASRCTSWFQKRQQNQRSNSQHPLLYIIEIAREFQKISTSASLTILKPLTVRSQLWTILNEMEITDHIACLLKKPVGRTSSNSQNQTRNNRLSKSGKEYIKAVYCHPAYLTSMQSEKKVKLLSHVRLFATPWTVAYQASQSMGFSRQEYWSGLPLPSPGDLPDPGIKPRSPSLQADALLSEPPGKPKYMQRTSREMPGWVKHKLESRLLKEISTTSDRQMIPL